MNRQPLRSKTSGRKAKKSDRRRQQRHMRDCAKRTARAKRCLRATRIKNNPGCTKS